MCYFDSYPKDVELGAEDDQAKGSVIKLLQQKLAFSRPSPPRKATKSQGGRSPDGEPLEGASNKT